MKNDIFLLSFAIHFDSDCRVAVDCNKKALFRHRLQQPRQMTLKDGIELFLSLVSDARTERSLLECYNSYECYNSSTGNKLFTTAADRLWLGKFKRDKPRRFVPK